MGTKRKIGVGVCGLAELLLTAGLPYDSPEGRQLAQEVLAFITYTSKLASVELAARRGPCPAIHTGIAIPPTGRSAPVIGASTGIEPLFRLTDPHQPGHLHPAAHSVLEQAGRSDLIEHVMTHGRLPEDAGLPAPLASVLATATQIAPSGHLAMAAAVQACVDETVSKTVNLPATARAIDVYDTYLSAWELACKGITV